MTKRKEFSDATKRKARERAGGRCERCGTNAAARYEWNHHLPCYLGGGNGVSNAELLCADGKDSCHAKQTRRDIKAFAKIRRIRGETRSQWAKTHRGRGRLSKHTKAKPLMQREKWNGGDRAGSIPSRPLGDKRWRKKLSGEVVRV